MHRTCKEHKASHTSALHCTHTFFGRGVRITCAIICLWQHSYRGHVACWIISSGFCDKNSFNWNGIDLKYKQKLEWKEETIKQSDRIDCVRSREI